MANAVVSSPISFPIPLAAAPSVVIAPNPLCPGSVSVPTAAPGVLCIYKGQNVNAVALLVTDDQGVSGHASPQGAGLQVISNTVGDSIGQGSWAVTAP
jgi:hypothetical protein